jgi:hypothetical protein
MAEGSYLKSYVWSSGKSAEDAVTDAQVNIIPYQFLMLKILIHLFCTFMDEQLSPVVTYTAKVFSTCHFVMTPAKPRMYLVTVGTDIV